MVLNDLKCLDKKNIKKLISKLQLIAIQPFVLLACLNFILRKFFFGPQNAMNYLKFVDSPCLIFILRLFGASIGKNCNIQPGIIFHNCVNFKNLSIGDNCHIGKNCFFDLRDYISIKDNVVISMHCKLITHIDMSNSVLNSKFRPKCAPISIGDDSYLGAGCIVLMGVILGARVIVGSSSLVKDSFTDDNIVAGIPCKIINI